MRKYYFLFAPSKTSLSCKRFSSWPNIEIIAVNWRVPWYFLPAVFISNSGYIVLFDSFKKPRDAYECKWSLSISYCELFAEAKPSSEGSICSTSWWRAYLQKQKTGQLVLHSELCHLWYWGKYKCCSLYWSLLLSAIKGSMLCGIRPQVTPGLISNSPCD